MPKEDRTNQPNQTSLFAQLNEHFSLDELRELCFELGIDPEALEMRRKRSFVMDLLRYCQQHDLVSDLVEIVGEKRPFLAHLSDIESIDLGLPTPPLWQRPAVLIPAGILIVLTIMTTLIVNFGGGDFIASRIFTPTPTVTLTPTPTITPTPTATPLPIAVAQPGELLIVIATFARTEGVADAQAQVEIQRGIQAAAADLAFANLRVEVVPDVLQSDDRAGAVALAELYGAGLIIWGSETAVRITTNFLNVAADPYESRDVQLSVTRPDAYVQFITEDLPGQFAFLSLFAVGQSYYLEEAYDEAIAVLETAVANITDTESIAKEAAQAYFRLGWLYHEPKADFAAAAAAYEQAITLDETDHKSYYNRAVIFLENEEYEQAVAYFTAVIDLVPDELDPYLNRGLARKNLEDFEGALRDYTTIIEQDPQYVDAYNNRGVVYAELGEFEKALADYAAAIELDPDSSSAYYNRAILYSNTDELEKSLADFDTAIQLNPTDPNAFLIRGFVHADLENYKQAVLDFTETLRLNPEEQLAYLNRGNAYQELGELEQAIADYTEAIRLDPTDYTPYLKRGVIYIDLLQYDEALADYRTAQPFVDDAEAAELVEAIISDLEQILDN